MASRIAGRLIGLAALLIAGLLPTVALGATLYVTEFASPISQDRSQTAQNLPQPAITSQTVTFSGASVQSAAFNANTHGIQVYCDAGCSVVVGANPTATTSNQVLTANQPQTFTVVPGQIIAVIANSSGNPAAGTPTGITSVNLNQVGGASFSQGQKAMAASLPVVIASDQSAVSVSNFNGALQSDGDGISNTNSTVQVLNSAGLSAHGYSIYPWVYNNSTWDRMRSGGVTGMVGVTPQATPSGGASYTHIAAGQATTTVKSGAGTIYAIIFNTKATATNVTTLYDNTAGSGTVIGIPDAVNVAVGQAISYGPVGLAFSTGLTIVTATANGSDMTVVYK